MRSVFHYSRLLLLFVIGEVFIFSSCHIDENYLKGKESFHQCNYVDAFKYLQKGGTEAYEMLGVLHYLGLGGAERDFEKAAIYLEYAKNEPEAWYCRAELTLVNMQQKRMEEVIGSVNSGDMYITSYYRQVASALENYRKAKELGYDGDNIEQKIKILGKVTLAGENMPKRQSLQGYRYHKGQTFYGMKESVTGKEGWGILVNLNNETVTLGRWKENHLVGKYIIISSNTKRNPNWGSVTLYE